MPKATHASATLVATRWLAFVTMAGCVSVAGLTGGDAGSGEAGSADARVTDGSSAPPDASADSGPVNLLVNPGFENGVVGCGVGWNATDGTIARSSVAHSGTYSCEVCPDLSSGGTGFVLVSGAQVTATTPNQSFAAAAWIHESSSGGGGPAQGRIELWVTTPDGGNDYPTSTGVGGTATWQQITLQAQTSNVGDQIQFSVAVDITSAGCLLVDDVALYAQ